MISGFDLYLIAFIIRCLLACVPMRLSCIHFKGNFVCLSLIIHAVKYMKFKLRSDYHFICNTASPQIILGIFRYVSGILVKGTIVGQSNHHDISYHRECRYFRKLIKRRRGQNRDKNHVAFFDFCISVIRTVKTYTRYHDTFFKTCFRNCDMPPTSVKIHHFKIYRFDSMTGTIVFCFFKTGKHHIPLKQYIFRIKHAAARVETRKSKPRRFFGLIRLNVITS